MARPSRAEVFVRRFEQTWGKLAPEMRARLLMAGEDLMLEHDLEKKNIRQRELYWRKRAPHERMNRRDDDEVA